MAKELRTFLPHEKFYIEENPDNLSPKELAIMFNRTEQTIRNVQNRFRLKNGEPKRKTRKPKPVENTNETPPPSQTIVEPISPNVPSKGPNVGNLMGHHKKNGQVVATIMTEAAAELADEVRKTNKKTMSESLKNSVFKPRG